MKPVTNFLKRPLGIVLILVAAAGIIGFIALSGRNTETAYDSIRTERGAVVQEVSVTGKVQAAESVNLSFEKTGTVASLPVSVGQRVEAGQLLAQLAAQDGEKQVRDAEVVLEEARLDLEKLQQEQQQLLRGDVLNKNYEGGLAMLGAMYGELDSLLEDLDDIFFGDQVTNGGDTNIQYYAQINGNGSAALALEQLYKQATSLQQEGVAEYRAAERGGGEQRLRAIETGYEAAVKTAETIKAGEDEVRAFRDEVLSDTTTHDEQETIDQHAQDLAAHASTIDAYVESLLEILNTINEQLDTQENYPLDLNSQELVVQQQENELRDARAELAEYSLVAPIDAVVTKRDATVGETVTANTPVITIISEAQLEIEANIPEADIAKVQEGNKAVVTLDAYGSDETFETTVAKIDPAETVIEGVTTYRIVLQFTQADERVKSGMTADITISTAQKENVIAIPQRAVIRQNGSKFVRVVRAGSIEQVQVETGLQGSDGTVEIVSGLNEDDEVITFFPE